MVVFCWNTYGSLQCISLNYEYWYLCVFTAVAVLFVVRSVLSRGLRVVLERTTESFQCPSADESERCFSKLYSKTRTLFENICCVSISTSYTMFDFLHFLTMPKSYLWVFLVCFWVWLCSHMGSYYEVY